MTGFPPLEARVLFSRAPTAADPEAAWRAAGPVERGAADRAARALERLGVRAPLAGEPDYPVALRDLPDAPRVLFVRGALPERSRAVAVVGSRAATPYGLARAGALGADLARLGYTVVSGLARGIDGAAHRGALEAGGTSVAVLPGGLDAITPRHHAGLAEALCVRGGLLSERASGPPPFRWTFLERNRLIAALTAATVVVEAAARSGALATAACARYLGRPVLAVPGDVDRETSRGAHALIRAGATLCESAGDVLGVLGRGSGCGGEAGPEARLGAVLRAEPRGVDELAAAAGLAVDETLALLLQFEWAGAVVALPGQRWRRAPS
jgi:DNA processing protein